MQTHVIIVANYMLARRQLIARGAEAIGNSIRLRTRVSVDTHSAINAYLKCSDIGAIPVSGDVYEMRLYPIWVMDLMGGHSYDAVKRLQVDCVIIHDVDLRRMSAALNRDSVDLITSRILDLVDNSLERIIGGHF